MLALVPVVISSGLRAAPQGDKLGMFTLHWPTERIACIFNKVVKTMNAKNTKKSPIHENADANITCDFGDGDISRFRSRLPHTSLARL